MKGAEPSRGGVLKYRTSRTLAGLFGGFPGNPQGPRRRLGEFEYEEAKDYEETEVAASLEGVPEALEAPNLALHNKPLFSQARSNFLKMMEEMTQVMGKLPHAVAPRDN
ncbi:hypothetical protein O181_044212 [Austropuccinia psidii MF-1]|uniref:Uncharacterized protein n=1 Tax=Austropuccinia psidii MF-1 TaxID=1389203 RepID=A0A9Q3DRD3_9BASI|nr:hypothetical protein [Austropuccinia psidii MF-1]